MKVIQVGIGGMGNAWLKAVIESEEVEFAGFVEINDQIAAQQIEKHSLDPRHVFTSLDAALGAVQADAIINVTPPQTHKEISCFALRTGVPVLSEKPLAGTLQDAQEIVDVSNATGVLHMVAQNYRYHVPVQSAKRVLDTGELGAVGALTVDFYKGPHFGGFREEMPYPLIIDMAIHHFDLMRFFLESNPVSVYGRSWNPPWSWFRHDASASVSIEFTGGVIAAYNGSWCSNAQETPWNANWRFECEHGVLLLRDDQVFVQHSRAHLPKTNQSVDGDNPMRLVAPLAMPRQAQGYLLHEFYEAVMHGIEPATTCQDNIRSLEIVFDTITAFETDRVVHSRHSLNGPITTD